MDTNQKDAPRRRKILVVDDDVFAADTMKSFLGEWYDVLTAKTAEEAVSTCRAALPDVVLMDLMMPSPTWEGDEAIRRLAKDPTTARIPVVIHTGFTGGLNLKAIAPNVVDIVVKPYALTELKRRLEEVLARA
jgi:CheY-like chemotaxis protein